MAVDTGFTLQDVAVQAGVGRLEILEKECSQQLLLSLAKLCVDWKLIGFHLDLTRAEVVAVDGDNHTIDIDEKRVGMLGRWREKFAFKATYQVLIEALLACGRTSDAVDARKTIATG